MSFDFYVRNEGLAAYFNVFLKEIQLRVTPAEVKMKAFVFRGLKITNSTLFM